jgi:hypothetical protein
MYIVAIAWIYVTLLMALTETSFVAGLATFLFYGLFPLALFLWLVGTPERRRRRLRAANAANAAAGVETGTALSDLEPAAPGSGIDPDERGHPPPGGSSAIGPEARGIGEGAKPSAPHPPHAGDR